MISKVLEIIVTAIETLIMRYLLEIANLEEDLKDAIEGLKYITRKMRHYFTWYSYHNFFHVMRGSRILKGIDL